MNLSLVACLKVLTLLNCPLCVAGDKRNALWLSIRSGTIFSVSHAFTRAYRLCGCLFVSSLNLRPVRLLTHRPYKPPNTVQFCCKLRSPPSMSRLLFSTKQGEAAFCWTSCHFSCMIRSMDSSQRSPWTNIFTVHGDKVLCIACSLLCIGKGTEWVTWFSSSKFSGKNTLTSASACSGILVLQSACVTLQMRWLCDKTLPPKNFCFVWRTMNHKIGIIVPVTRQAARHACNWI